MTTEEKIKTILVNAQIPTRCYRSACSEIEALLASEITAEKINLLEGLLEAKEMGSIAYSSKMCIHMLIRELREEGKEKGKV